MQFEILKRKFQQVLTYSLLCPDVRDCPIQPGWCIIRKYIRGACQRPRRNNSSDYKTKSPIKAIKGFTFVSTIRNHSATAVSNGLGYCRNCFIFNILFCVKFQIQDGYETNHYFIFSVSSLSLASDRNVGVLYSTM